MLPYGSAMLMLGAAAGGGAGGMSAGPTLRGSNLQTFTANAFQQVPIPAAAVANDLFVGFASSTQHLIAVGSGEGTWSVDYQHGTEPALCSTVFHKRLDAADITRGYVTVRWNTTVDGMAGCVVFVDSGTSTDGSDVLAGLSAPTTGSGTTWNSGTGVATCSGGAQLISWNVPLVAGKTYHASIPYTKTAGSKLRLNNGATNGSNVSFTSAALANGSGTLDFTFTALGTYFALEADSALYSGTLGPMTCKPVTFHPDYRSVAALNDDSTSSAETVTTGTDPVTGDYAFMFAIGRTNVVASVNGNPGSAVQSLSSTSPAFSGVSRLGTLLAGGSFSKEFDFSPAASGGNFCGIVIIQA